MNDGWELKIDEVLVMHWQWPGKEVKRVSGSRGSSSKEKWFLPS